MSLLYALRTCCTVWCSGRPPGCFAAGHGGRAAELHSFCNNRLPAADATCMLPGHSSSPPPHWRKHSAQCRLRRCRCKHHVCGKVGARAYAILQAPHSDACRAHAVQPRLCQRRASGRVGQPNIILPWGPGAGAAARRAPRARGARGCAAAHAAGRRGGARRRVGRAPSGCCRHEPAQRARPGAAAAGPAGPRDRRAGAVAGRARRHPAPPRRRSGPRIRPWQVA